MKRVKSPPGPPRAQIRKLASFVEGVDCTPAAKAKLAAAGLLEVRMVPEYRLSDAGAYALIQESKRPDGTVAVTRHDLAAWGSMKWPDRSW